MKQQTLIWIAVAIAAFYFYNKSKTSTAMNYSYAPSTGSDVSSIVGDASNLISDYF